MSPRDVATAALVVLCQAACSNHHSGVVSGPADAHCVGVAPPTIGTCVTDPNASKSRPARQMVSDYGATMYGSAGDDDDCKYHVSWSADDVARNQDVTFTITASVLATQQPMAAAALPRVEAELGTDHPAPNTQQKVTNPKPGVFDVGPVRFDAKGRWVVRFHFYEICSDADSDSGASPHGHAAFYVDVP